MYNIQWAKVFHSGGGFFNFYGKFDKGWFVSDTDDIVHVYSADTTEMIKEWCDSGDTLTWEKRYEKKKEVHKYDKGLINNFYEMFGDNFIFWLIPF